jgi:transposase
MRSLMLAFRSILRQPVRRSSRTRPIRTAAALRRWLERAEASGIAVIGSFVEQLRRDVRAVEAAVTERWSNGPVEGHVNRLKTLKRQMYGQAGVELLRARLIPLPCDLPAVQRV